jgi:hypothetical protein
MDCKKADSVDRIRVLLLEDRGCGGLGRWDSAYCQEFSCTLCCASHTLRCVGQ